MPGRSTTVAWGCLRIWPSLRSTVTPGKLPTCWLEPVSWLNRVVLPQFWLPASANTRGVSSARAVRFFSPWPGWGMGGMAALGAAGASPGSPGSPI